MAKSETPPEVRKNWQLIIKAACDAGLTRERKAALYCAYYFLGSDTNQGYTVAAYIAVHGLHGYAIDSELPANWFNRIIENRAGCVCLGGVFYPVFLTVNI